MVKMMETLTALKEEVETLKEERPRKKKEKGDDEMSYTLVSDAQKAPKPRF